MIAALCLFGVLICLPGSESPPGPLSFFITGEAAPSVVTITGPSVLLACVAQVARMRRACIIDVGFYDGFWINWGDDPYGTRVDVPILGSDGCVDWLKHTYTVPGKYRLFAVNYHPGPDDGPVSEWGDEAFVTVGGTPPKLAFKLIDPLAGAAFGEEPLLNVSWDLATPIPVDLSLTLVAENGQTLLTQRYPGLSYVGRGEAQLHPYNVHEYLAVQGPIAVRVRAILTSGGRVLTIQESGPITLTQSPVGLGHYETILTDGQTGTVTLRHVTKAGRCHDYVIDWGDGSPLEKPAPPSDTGCFGEVWIENVHHYATPGVYRAILRTNENQPGIRAEDSPYYRVFQIGAP